MALSSHLSRRDALKLGALGSAALLLPFERRALTKNGFSAGRIASSKLPTPYTRPFAVPPVLQPIKRDATTDYYRVSADRRPVEIIPGLRTPIFGYNGILPGPTVSRAARPAGRRAADQQAARATHPTLGLHAVDLDAPARLRRRCRSTTATPSDVTQPGQYKDYQYPNIQDARTLWYHDHGVHHTAENVYMGLAAQYHLHDDAEQALGLPQRRLRRPADHQRRDVRRGRLAAVRRQRPLRLLR